MQNKVAPLFFALAILCLALPGCKREKPSDSPASPRTPPDESRPKTHTLPGGRVVSEILIGRIDFSSWIQESFKVSPDSKRFAYVCRAANKRHDSPR